MALLKVNTGIGTTNPTSALHVIGDGRFTGVVTATSFSGNASSATYATSAGIATYATSSGITTNLKDGLAGNIPYQSAPDATTFLANGASGTILQSNGVGNAPSWVTAAPASAITGLTVRDEGTIVGGANSVSQLNFVGNIVSVASTAGIATVTFLDYVNNAGIATYATTSGVSTSVIGGVASVTQIYASGISTIANVTVTPVGTGATVGGIGITYYGDGSQLSNIISGITISDEGSVVGSSVTTLNFVGSNISASNASSGVSTITVAVNYVDNAGIATYATSAGIATYANTSGIASALTSTASVNTIGIITASQFSTGSGTLGFNTNTISGPSEIVIDPAAVGDNTGAVRIKGDLYVDGTQFVVNSTTIELADFNVGIATTVGTNALLDGAGIGIGSTNIRKTITWNNTAGALTSSEDWNLASGKIYEIGGTSVLSSTTLGSGVVNSSLTSVGTLGQLNVSGITTTNNLNVTGVGTFLSSGLKIRNPANTFQYNITGDAIAADRTLNLPVITTTDTLATLGLSQTFSGTQTFNAITATGQVTLTTTGSSVLTLGASLQTGTMTLGQSTASQTTNIQAGATASGNTKTINLGTGGLSGSSTQINIGPTAGVGTVAINSGTNLGIGSATPTSKLDVVGDAKFTGVVTATSFSGNASSATYATSSGISTYASTAGIATYASTAGIATYSTSAGIATNLKGGSGGTIVYQSAADTTAFLANGSSGQILQSNGGTSAPSWVNAAPAGAITGLTVRDEGTIVGGANSVSQLNFVGNIVSVASTAGIATVTFLDYVNNSGIATYATTSGVSTSVSGGTGSLTQLQVTGISTFSNGPMFIGAATSTGTVAQRLQVTGGAYVSGFVGVGTTNPQYIFTVTDTGTPATVGLTNCLADFTTTANSYGQINLRNTSTGTNASSDIIVTADNGSDTTNFIDLGINNSAYSVGSWTINGANDGYLYTSDGNLSIGAINASVPKYISFFTGGTLISNERMRVNATGVGIGTTNPQATLQVGTGITMYGDTGIISATSYRGDGSQLTGISAGLTVSDDTSTNATRYILFDDITSGSISAINVSSTKLTFNPSTGNLVAGGTVTANSDRKLKTDVQTIENALEKVLSLRGVEFTRIDNGDKQIGVIAQEVEEIIPEVVYPKQPAPNNETKSVAYGNIVGLLIEAIKEQNKEIQELKRRLEEG